MKLVKLFFFVQFIVFAACNPSKKSDCTPYFEFDELEHYSITTTIEDERKLVIRDSLSLEELRLNDVLIQRRPTTLSDTPVVLNLEKIGFVKKNINRLKFENINTIFCERKHKEVFGTLCIPAYRDILIFRRKGQIVGIAKICFECSQHVITGANGKTEEFGQSGDYQRLRKLLY